MPRGVEMAMHRGHVGFTLLEVLVALLLMSLALAGLMRLSALEARAAAQLRDTTLAQWVASNAIAETRLRESFPAIGTREGESAMAGRQWRWRMRVSGTEEPTIRRLDVSVFAPEAREGEALVANLTGFAVQ
jgi:general secretion pathway protein I